MKVKRLSEEDSGLEDDEFEGDEEGGFLDDFFDDED